MLLIDYNKLFNNMTTYYKHNSSCGSGYDSSYIKIEPDNKVTINLRWGWMGQGRTNCDLECTLYPISGPYHIIKVNKFTELFKDENKVHNKDAYFDTYIFNEVLETEWCKYPMEDIPIGLYIGNGCQSNEKFQLQLFDNKTVMCGVTKDDPLKHIVYKLNGSKYEIMKEDDYNKVVNRITHDK